MPLKGFCEILTAPTDSVNHVESAADINPVVPVPALSHLLKIAISTSLIALVIGGVKYELRRLGHTEEGANVAGFANRSF